MYNLIYVVVGIAMRIYDLITKDVKAENENKRIIVALRILDIIVFLAFILDLSFAGLEVISMHPYRIFILIVMNIGHFVFTYFSKTKHALYIFMIFLFAWSLAMMPCFGWSAGMQNYFIIVLMLCFFAMYTKTFVKFMHAGMVLVLRIVTIWIYGGIKPETNISRACDKMLQITNISAVFISIIFISYMFSKIENEAENKLMKYNDRLKQEANTDQLTGLFNRRKAKEFMTVIEKTKEYNLVSIAMGDIDFFKKVNDTYGHDAGDEVLKYVANAMKEKCGDEAFVARWGGEEFLIILPGRNGDDAFVMLEKIRIMIQNSVIKVGNEEIKVTMTFGLSESGFDTSAETAIKEADERLYYGKSHGRNQVVY